MTALFRDEPALVGTVVSAAVGLALGLGLDPTLGAAIASLVTVLAGVWIRSSVYPQKAVDVLVHAGAQQTAADLAAADTGAGGQLTTTGQAVADKAASDVLEGVTPPGPKGDADEHGAGMILLVVLAVLIMVGVFTTCDLLVNDESEPGDDHLLGRVELVHR